MSYLTLITLSLVFNNTVLVEGKGFKGYIFPKEYKNKYFERDTDKLFTPTIENIMEVEKLLNQALEFANGKTVKAKSDIFVANLFFEDSTRTKISFEVAEKKLGLHVVHFDESKSSINKGESLLDTIKTLESIGINLSVIRHQKTRFYDELKGVKMGVVNAGDGIGHHPSQALLDLITIKQEFGDFKDLKVVKKS